MISRLTKTSCTAEPYSSLAMCGGLNSFDRAEQLDIADNSSFEMNVWSVAQLNKALRPKCPVQIDCCLPTVNHLIE